LPGRGLYLFFRQPETALSFNYVVKLVLVIVDMRLLYLAWFQAIQTQHQRLSPEEGRLIKLLCCRALEVTDSFHKLIHRSLLNQRS
jgi:hypothetical protein